MYLLFAPLVSLNCCVLHCQISSLSQMDSEGYDVVEFILCLAEVEMGYQREKTREMVEQLRADRAAMEAKENERLMLMAEKDEMLAVTMTVDKLVDDFLEADDNKNFDAQRARENEIVALMSRDGSHDGINTGGSGGSVNGENIGYLENGDRVMENQKRR